MVDDDDVDARMLGDFNAAVRLSSKDHVDVMKVAVLNFRDSECLCSNIHKLWFHEGLEKVVEC